MRLHLLKDLALPRPGHCTLKAKKAKPKRPHAGKKSDDCKGVKPPKAMSKAKALKRAKAKAKAKAVLKEDSGKRTTNVPKATRTQVWNLGSKNKNLDNAPTSIGNNLRPATF